MNRLTVRGRDGGHLVFEHRPDGHIDVSVTLPADGQPVVVDRALRRNLVEFLTGPVADGNAYSFPVHGTEPGSP